MGSGCSSAAGVATNNSGQAANKPGAKDSDSTAPEQDQDSKGVTVVHSFPSGDSVAGLGIVASFLYVVRSPTNQQIEVYNVNDFRLVYKIDVPNLGDFTWGLATCNANRCVYVGNWGMANAIHRVDLSDNEVKTDRREMRSSSWNVEMVPTGMSVNGDKNLMVAFWSSPGIINEYTTKGSLKRTYRLSPDVAYPWLAVQLTTGKLLVCHGSQDSLHRVMYVKSNGDVERSYGDEPGISAGKLKDPRHLTVGKNNFFVADCDNDRIVVLDKTLNRVRFISIAGGLRRPNALFRDNSSGRLFVGEVNGRILVLEIN